MRSYYINNLANRWQPFRKNKHILVSGKNRVKLTH